MENINLGMILEARERLKGVAQRTGLVEFRALSQENATSISKRRICRPRVPSRSAAAISAFPPCQRRSVPMA